MSGAEAVRRALARMFGRGRFRRGAIPLVAERGVLHDDAWAHGLAPRKGSMISGSHAGERWVRTVPGRGGVSVDPSPPPDAPLDPPAPDGPQEVRRRLRAYCLCFSATNAQANGFLAAGFNAINTPTTSDHRTIAFPPLRGELVAVVVCGAAGTRHVEIDIIDNGSVIASVSRQAFILDNSSSSSAFVASGASIAAPGVALGANGLPSVSVLGLEVRTNARFHGAMAVLVFIRPEKRMGALFQFAGQPGAMSGVDSYYLNNNSTVDTSTATTADQRHQACIPFACGGSMSGHPIIGTWSKQNAATSTPHLFALRRNGTRVVGWDASGQSGSVPLAGVDYNWGRGDILTLEQEPAGTTGTGPGRCNFWVYLPYLNPRRDACLIPFANTSEMARNLYLWRDATLNDASAVSAHQTLLAPLARGGGYTDGGLLVDLVGVTAGGGGLPIVWQSGQEGRERMLSVPGAMAAADESADEPLGVRTALPLFEGRWVTFITGGGQGQMVAWACIE